MEYICYVDPLEDKKAWCAQIWKRVPYLSDRWGIAGPPKPETRAAMAGKQDPGWVASNKS